MRKITKAILTVTILATPLAADPVRGLFASLNLGLTKPRLYKSKWSRWQRD